MQNTLKQINFFKNEDYLPSTKYCISVNSKLFNNISTVYPFLKYSPFQGSKLT